MQLEKITSKAEIARLLHLSQHIDYFGKKQSIWELRYIETSQATVTPLVVNAKDNTIYLSPKTLRLFSTELNQTEKALISLTPRRGRPERTTIAISRYPVAAHGNNRSLLLLPPRLVTHDRATMTGLSNGRKIRITMSPDGRNKITKTVGGMRTVFLSELLAKQIPMGTTNYHHREVEPSVLDVYLTDPYTPEELVEQARRIWATPPYEYKES